jgi:hypothetical protein
MPKPRKPVKPSLMRRIGCGSVLLALLGAFTVLFIPELLRILDFFWQLLKVVIGLPYTGPGAETIRAAAILCFNCCGGFLIVLLLWSFIAAPAVLPVRNISQRMLAFIYFLLSILGRHGPRILIRDGKVQATTAEQKRLGPSTVVVDPHSAGVLETRVLPSNKSMIFVKMLMRLLEMVRLINPPQSPQVIGPGLTFTHPLERLRGTVDLRKQIRYLPGATGYTRDGIELTTTVWCLFSLGQELDPDALQVTYVGDARPENLRVLTLENLPDGRVRVTGMNNELDAVDREEIHQYGRVIWNLGELQDYQPLPPINPVPQYIPANVFAAVIHQPRQDEETLRSWSELPGQVGQDIYREVLAHINYDNLYKLDQPDHIPAEDMRRDFRRRMIHSGKLAFRLVFHVSRDQQIRERQVYEALDLLVSPVTELRNPKVLRERGIKVLFCGIGDLKPPEAIYQQRLESWQSLWKRDAELTLADHELEANRLRNRARAQAQQDLTFTLEAVFRNESVSDEVMAIRLLQALESAAADPKTRQLLPSDTINLMRGMHDWLLPGDVPGKGQPTPPSK